MFPVGRVHRILKNRAGKLRNQDKKLRNARVSENAAILMTVVLETMTADLIDVIATAALRNDRKNKRITPNDISEFLKKDPMFSPLFKNVQICGARDKGIVNEKLLEMKAKDYFDYIRNEMKQRKLE